MSERYSRSIVWVRRDLRLADNTALLEACRRSERVCLAFVANPQLLAQDRMGSPLVCVFFDALAHLRADLRERGSDLVVCIGDFAKELLACADRIEARAVFFNADYEPQAIARDRSVSEALESRGVRVHRCLDHVYFGADEVERAKGEPYRVYTAYKRRWLEQRAVAPRLPRRCEHGAREKLLARDVIGETAAVPQPADFGFSKNSSFPQASERIAQRHLNAFLAEGGAVERYRDDRNFPSLASTSFLSPQLRAGTISIRTCVEAAFARLSDAHRIVRINVETWISELIWRDFYQMILARFPHVADGPFVARAANIAWRPPGEPFEAWCAGRTGYPIVDAAMRQLEQTGWMHNRLRMVTASFLSKHLLVDWRFGERYFEQHLADADLAQNNGGWQWAASTGTDAAPYVRIFSPSAQSKRFDPRGTFIRRMLPELEAVPDEFIHEPWRMPLIVQAHTGVRVGTEYPLPIVDHDSARMRALAAFKNALTG